MSLHSLEASKARHPSGTPGYMRPVIQNFIPPVVPRKPRVLPLAPLLEASKLTLSALGRGVHRSHASMVQARNEGLTTTQASDWCDRLGLFPSEIWGRGWFEVIEGEVL
jgi:hypothetical protein